MASTDSNTIYTSVPNSDQNSEPATTVEKTSDPVGELPPPLENTADTLQGSTTDVEAQSTDVPIPAESVPESAPLKAHETPSAPNEKGQGTLTPQAPKPDNLSIHGTAPLYETLTPREQKLILYSALCARFLAVLDATIVAVTLPSILRDLGGEHYLSWLIAAYLLSDSVVLPLSGRLSDIYGRRVIYLVSLTIFLVGSALCGAATSIWFLIIARFVQGIGGGGLTGMTMIIPGDIIAPKDRPGIFALLGIIAGMAALLGPVLGGGLTDAYSWRLVFYVNLPPGIFSFCLAVYSMKRFEVPKKKLELDYLGSALIAAATVCLILFVTWGGVESTGYPWDSPVIISLIVLFGVFSILFVIQEYRHPLPTLQLRLHKIRNVWINLVIIFFSYYSMISVVNYMAVYFQTVQGDLAVISGLKLGGFVLGFIVVSRFSGKLLNKTSKSNYIMGFSGCVLALGLGLTSLVTPDLNYGYVFLFTAIMGIGVGYQIPVTGAMIQLAVPQREIAVAMANFSFDSYIGGCIGVTVSGTIYTRTLQHYLNQGYSYKDASSHGISSVFLWCVPPVAAAGLLGFFLHPVKQKRIKTKPVPDEPKSVEMTSSAQSGTTTNTAPTVSDQTQVSVKVG